MSIMMCADCFKMIDVNHGEVYSVKGYYRNEVLDKHETALCKHFYEEYIMEEEEK